MTMDSHDNGPADSAGRDVEPQLRLTLGSDDRAFCDVEATTAEGLDARSRLFDTLLRTIPVGIFMLDADGRVTLWSDGATRIFGWSAEEALGRVNPTIGPQEADEFKGILTRLLAGEVLREFETERMRKDGSRIPVMFSAAPVHDASGQATGIIVAISDSTERQRSQHELRESADRYRGLFMQLLEGYAYCRMLYDEHGKAIDFVYLEVNDNFGPLTGLGDVTGKRVTEIIPGIHETNPEIISTYDDVIRTGDPAEFETFLPQLDRILHVSAYSPEGEHFVAVFEDVTERRRNEKEILALNKELELRVDERTMALEVANTELASMNEELVRSNEELSAVNEELTASNQELEAVTEALSGANEELLRANERLDDSNRRLDDATRAKSEFLASMSHELRTPLNSILGFSGILLQDMAGPLNDEQRRQIGMVATAGRHLLALINDVLDLARIEAGQMQIGLELFSPSDAASSVVDSLAPLAADQGLALTFEDHAQGLHIQSDPMRFQQILLNLLGNAIKFTKEGSVTLALEPEGTGVRAIVADTGPGIAADVLASVFEDFYQVPRADGAKTVGTGLGLPVSRKLAEMLGGTLAAESTEGGGSTFTLFVPGSRANA